LAVGGSGSGGDHATIFVDDTDPPEGGLIGQTILVSNEDPE
jgi:hypothetical protein